MARRVVGSSDVRINTGATTYRRGRLNLIPSNILTISLVDDPTNDELDITFGGGTTLDNGGVLFGGPAGEIAQDTANFFYDNPNNRLGIRTMVPGTALSFGTHTTTEGGISFGTDTFLHRILANTLRTPGHFQVGDGTTLDQSIQFNTFPALGAGIIRSTHGLLFLIDQDNAVVSAFFEVGHNNTAFGGTYESLSQLNEAGQLKLPLLGSTAGLLLGGDANLYRDAADVLKTDDSFKVAGAIGVTLLAGSGAFIQESATAATTLIFKVKPSASTIDKFTIDASGKHEWGDGAVAVDTTLYRASASILQSDDLIRSSRSSSSELAFAAQISSNTVEPFAITAIGNIEWGSGTTGRDIEMRREAANRLGLASGDAFHLASSFLLLDGTNFELRPRSTGSMLPDYDGDSVTEKGVAVISNVANGRQSIRFRREVASVGSGGIRWGRFDAGQTPNEKTDFYLHYRNLFEGTPITVEGLTLDYIIYGPAAGDDLRVPLLFFPDPLSVATASIVIPPIDEDLIENTCRNSRDLVFRAIYDSTAGAGIAFAATDFSFTWTIDVCDPTTPDTLVRRLNMSVDGAKRWAFAMADAVVGDGVATITHTVNDTRTFLFEAVGAAGDTVKVILDKGDQLIGGVKDFVDGFKLPCFDSSLPALAANSRRIYLKKPILPSDPCQLLEYVGGELVPIIHQLITNNLDHILSAIYTFTNQLTVTGVEDVTGTLRIPRKTDPVSPVTGEIWVNSETVKIRDNQAIPVTQTLLTNDVPSVTLTGIWNFTGTIQVPRKADPIVPAVGELWFNTASEILEYRDNAVVPGNRAIVNTDSAQTLTNKTLGTGTILSLLDTNFTLQDNLDSTKQLRFELSGISTLTTRTLTVPNVNSTIEVISNKNIANGYAGLDAGAKVLLAQISEVLAITNLSDVAAKTGTGTTAVFATGPSITSLIIGTLITLDQTTADYTLTWANPAAARAISIPDPGGTDVFTFRDMTQTLLNKTLTTPTISDFTNANHGHTVSAGGGTLDGSAIATGTVAKARLPSDTVFTADAQTLTNKTLTNPRIGTAILDTNGNESIDIIPTVNAVNFLGVENSVAGMPVVLNADGTDTNITLDLRPKGTGKIRLLKGGSLTQMVEFDVNDLGANGVYHFDFPAIAATRNVLFPDPGAGGDTIAMIALAQTLTNKTLSGGTLTGTIAGSPVFSGAPDFQGGTLIEGGAGGVSFYDPASTGKKLQFDLAGITAATTRTLTIPNVSGTIARTNETLSWLFGRVSTDAEAIGAGTTAYFVPVGVRGNGTEGVAEMVVPEAMRVVTIVVNFTANAATADGTWNLRKNNVTVTSITITALTAGTYTATANVDFAQGDKINFQIVSGTGGSTTIRSWSFSMSKV